jgi:hypothetical protein
MVILKSDRLKKWLDLTGKNQEWIAEETHLSPGYISQVMNGAACSGEMVSSLLMLTNFEFENLFEIKENGIIGENSPKNNYKKFYKRVG